MEFGHGGDIRSLAGQAGCMKDELLDFSANINPFGPPDCLRQVVSRSLAEVVHYPDPHCLELRRVIASQFGVASEQVVCGNGSTELLYVLPRALGVCRAVIPIPSYIDYIKAASRAGLEIDTVETNPERGFSVEWDRIEPLLSGEEMLIVGQPGNPSGAMFDPDELLELADRHPSTIFVIDEAFADFLDGYQSLASRGGPNIVVLRSMTKFYAIPGLRLGFALAPARIARQLSDELQPWSVGSLAQAVGSAVLQEDDYAEETRTRVAGLREELRRALADFGSITVFPSPANYLLARLEKGDMDAPELARRLLARRIAIRVCDNYKGLDQQYFRVAVRSSKENERLLSAMAEVIGEPVRAKATRPGKRCNTPAIMFQGTSSNAGKSVLSAAFCRILLQDGFRVAPFKAQNMSLNSYVTRDGGEMGRAQVVQAQACRLDPDVRMNPVLLKPNSETGAQVIVLGKPVGNMDVNAYIGYKPRAFEAVKQAYKSLASEVDAIVLEGAGSPAEVNLKHHDIVNMKMADFAGAPVILVGDIDRGGVFASFVGTVEILSELERAMIAGFAINRFRGNQALLGDAIKYVHDRTGVPVFGVIPYINDLGIPEEDSVSFKTGRREGAARGQGQIEIAVIDVPHISNFTDFDPLDLEPDVCLRIVRKADDLDNPDAVIIPGSKNVPGDLAYLRESGLSDKIEALRLENVVILGICGGMQMLGDTIEDPDHLEWEGGTQPGLGFLALRTVLGRDKTLRAVTARHVPTGLELKGYEIHHGRTSGEGVLPVLTSENGDGLGYISGDGCVLGTYLHGLFDADAFRRWFIDDLRTRRGLTALKKIQVIFDMEPALDRLADIVRKGLDVDAVYREMGLR
jgi:adenosylcobyric acid synthase